MVLTRSRSSRVYSRRFEWVRPGMRQLSKDFSQYRRVDLRTPVSWEIWSMVSIRLRVTPGIFMVSASRSCYQFVE